MFANRANVLFSCALLSRTWLLLAIAASSRQMGDKLLSLLYPDHQWFYIGLALGALPLSRLLLPKLWQVVPLKWQLWCLSLLLLFDFSSQIYLLKQSHWQFEGLSAVTLWLCTMLIFIMIKAAVEKKQSL